MRIGERQVDRLTRRLEMQWSCVRRVDQCFGNQEYTGSDVSHSLAEEPLVDMDSLDLEFLETTNVLSKLDRLTC